LQPVNLDSVPKKIIKWFFPSENWDVAFFKYGTQWNILVWNFDCFSISKKKRIKTKQNRVLESFLEASWVSDLKKSNISDLIEKNYSFIPLTVEKKITFCNVSGLKVRDGIDFWRCHICHFSVKAIIFKSFYVYKHKFCLKKKKR